MPLLYLSALFCFLWRCVDVYIPSCFTMVSFLLPEKVHSLQGSNGFLHLSVRSRFSTSWVNTFLVNSCRRWLLFVYSFESYSFLRSASILLCLFLVGMYSVAEPIRRGWSWRFLKPEFTYVILTWYLLTLYFHECYYICRCIITPESSLFFKSIFLFFFFLYPCEGNVPGHSKRARTCLACRVKTDMAASSIFDEGKSRTCERCIITSESSLSSSNQFFLNFFLFSLSI